MISLDGWSRFNIWQHSAIVRDLYARRARDEAEEMTCAAQAAELLRPLVLPRDTVLDVGCASGYFFHSLRRRGLPVEYIGIDATADFIELGRRYLPAFGLPADRLMVGRIEDLDGKVDHVVCMNVISNIDNFHRPLERLLRIASKSMVLRESIADGASYTYVVDKYLDTGEPLRVHVNTYDRRALREFAQNLGFTVEEFTDDRTGGRPELVIDHPHHWCFMRMIRRSET